MNTEKDTFNTISTKRKKSKHILKIALIAVFFWSTQSVAMSLGTMHIDFSAILFPAFLISSLLMLSIKISLNRKDFINETINPFFKDFKKFLIGMIGSSLIFGSHLFFYWGIQIGPKVETNLTNFLWPLIFILLGYLTNKKLIENEKAKKTFEKIQRFIGNDHVEFKPENMNCDLLRKAKILVGFLGVMLIITHGSLETFTFSNWYGPIMGFVGGLLWAIFSIYLKFLNKISYIALFIFGTAVLSFFFWLFRGCPDLLPTIWISLYLGIFPLGIAMIAWEIAMKKGYTKQIAMLAFLIPLLSTIFLYLFKFDDVNSYSILGGSLVVFSNINFRDIEPVVKATLPKGIKKIIHFRFVHNI